jgi:hypothetical protein
MDKAELAVSNEAGVRTPMRFLEKRPAMVWRARQPKELLASNPCFRWKA